MTGQLIEWLRRYAEENRSHSDKNRLENPQGHDYAEPLTEVMSQSKQMN